MKDKNGVRDRLVDLAESGGRSGRYVYTDFLTSADAAEAFALAPEGSCRAFGGVDGCERVLLRFGDPEDLGYEEPFPIAVIRVEPLSGKYAEALTHRDYLGALMHLQIERDTIGDIVVRGKTAYVFCVSRITAFICENLTQVRHTSVRCVVPEAFPEEVRPQLVPVAVNTASERIDAVTAGLYHLPRAKAKELLGSGSVLVDGRECKNGSRLLKEGDRVSVRGFGKYVYRGIQDRTRKGREVVLVDRYE